MSKHEKKFYQSKAFSLLRHSWYRKLSDEGFLDIEWTGKPLKSHKTPTKSTKNNKNCKSTKPVLEEDIPSYAFDKYESSYLKNSNCRIFLLLKKMPPEEIYYYIQNNYNHYHAVKNFLTHVNLEPGIDKFMLELYAEGSSIRNICDQLKTFICKYPAKRTKHYSLFWVHTKFTKVLKEVMMWNRQHPEGHFFNPSEDYDDETTQ